MAVVLNTPDALLVVSETATRVLSFECSDGNRLFAPTACCGGTAVIVTTVHEFYKVDCRPGSEPLAVVDSAPAPKHLRGWCDVRVRADGTVAVLTLYNLDYVELHLFDTCALRAAWMAAVKKS